MGWKPVLSLMLIGVGLVLLHADVGLLQALGYAFIFGGGVYLVGYLAGVISDYRKRRLDKH